METLVLVCALIGGVLNRFSGYENVSFLPGRNVYYSILVASLLMLNFYGWQWALALFLGFVFYRIPGWYDSIDMGKNEGTLREDANTMLVRGLYFFPTFIFGAFITSTWLLLALLPAAAIASVLVYIVGNYVVSKFMKDPFWFIEFFVGVAYGAAIGYMLSFV
jgi:hypothetical protein